MKTSKAYEKLVEQVNKDLCNMRDKYNSLEFNILKIELCKALDSLREKA